MPPTAIILAAGVSRRLYPLTYDHPKCLLELGGKTILDRQIGALLANGVSTIHIALGFHRETIIAHLETHYPDVAFHFHINHHFFETNTAVSMLLCVQDIVDGDIVLMNGDVLYPEELLRRVIESSHANALAVEIKPCCEEEVKVVASESRRITAIGKKLIPEQCLGEFIGVAKLSAAFTRDFTIALKTLIDAGGKDEYFEAALAPLLADAQVCYEDISDLPCIEIDFLEDLEKARLLLDRWIGA